MTFTQKLNLMRFHPQSLVQLKMMMPNTLPVSDLELHHIGEMGLVVSLLRQFPSPIMYVHPVGIGLTFHLKIQSLCFQHTMELKAILYRNTYCKTPLAFFLT
jgi:hypothetical protein